MTMNRIAHVAEAAAESAAMTIVKDGGFSPEEADARAKEVAHQLARTMGIQVIITSSSDDKLARAKALGANHGINYKTTPDWEKAALGFTGGRGVDHVVEVGGAATLAHSFGAIRVGGKISMIGGLSGPATELNPGLISARRANVQGISVGSMQMLGAHFGKIVIRVG